MTGHLNRLYARRQDMRAAMRVLDQQIADEERRQSEALGYRMILRGPQLLEAMGRNVA
ncbi:MAG: hypothetical protein IT551_11870 [Novosphingobium sp.]|mgnify:FL=1|jgi:hypothetical protein|nr:hypothetical protein [Novosphingobium sp.]